MTQLAFFGGNSQVAVETAFHVNRLGHTVTLYGRGRYPQVPLEQFGLRYEVEPSSETALRDALGDKALIVEFAYPSGDPWMAVGRAASRIERLLRCMPRSARLAYMSSISAFGMAGDDSRLRWHRWPHTAYASSKRALESRASAMARHFGRDAFGFRLGQVHGVLQSASQSFRGLLAGPEVRVEGRAEGLSTSVFADGVASVLCDLDTHGLRPGIYTLTSHPQWRVDELVHFYRRLDSREGGVHYGESDPASIRRRTTSVLAGWLARNRGRLEPSLYRLPGLARRVRAWHRCREAAAAGASGSVAPPLLCLNGDVGDASHRIPTPGQEETLAHWRILERFWRDSIEARLR